MLQVDSDAVSLFKAELKENTKLITAHQGIMGQNNQLSSSSELVPMYVFMSTLCVLSVCACALKGCPVLGFH